MQDIGPLHILGLSGSLRKGSFNTAALYAAAKLAPAGVTLETFDLHPLPPYDEDVKAEGLPPSVSDLRAALRAADGVLIATPEYNYSFSGVLKNAIDWASRPPEQPFDDKPLAILSAGPGVLGGVRAQYHLRQCFVYLDAKIMNRPEIMIGGAGGKFDGAGELTDETTRQLLGEFMAEFQKWIVRIKASRS